MAPRIDYYLKESLQGMRRNALIALAAILTAFIALFLLGLALLVQRQANLLINFANADVQISIFLRDDINQAQQNHLQELLVSMPEVRNLHYESKEQAYQNFLRIFKNQPDLIENVSSDAIPASFRVDLHQPEQFEVIAARVAGQPGIDDIVDHREFLERLNAVTALFRKGVLWVAILMLVAAAALIGNTVRMAVFARRKEIGIMRLVGATNWFIRLPFLIEGVLAAMLGAGLAVAFLFVINWAYLQPLPTTVPFLPWVGAADVVATVPWLVAAGVGVAVSAGLLALGRYLEV
jgi:cell division transport system permease protein